MSEQVTFKVIGMTCGGCAGNVARALSNVAGVKQAVVDLKAGQAVIEYDPHKVTGQDLVKADKSVGFGVRSEFNPNG